jgi:hypothetical protein
MSSLVKTALGITVPPLPLARPGEALNELMRNSAGMVYLVAPT